MNTVEKNLSSTRPNPSRTTPMNHRNAMPANGIMMAAIFIRGCPRQPLRTRLGAFG